MELLKTKRYPAYKDSGIKWLGEVPEHWITRKGKWLFFKQERPVRKDDKIVTCFRDGQVTLRKNRKTEGFTNALKEHGYQGIRKGDLVIHCMDAFAGAIGVSDSDGKSTPVYSVCTSRINGVNLYYYSYFLRSLAKKGFIESLAKGIRERSTDFRFNDLGVLLLPFPPLVEQEYIADYLDKKTEQIDKAIAQKGQMIELLKERKQILINSAVTRGLTSDTPLKDSGIDWIGQIPLHWEVRRIKYIKSSNKNAFVDGPFGSNLKSEHFIENGDVYVVESGFITTGIFIDKEFKTISKKHFETIKRSECLGGDVIIAKIGANYGMAAELPILDKKAVVSGNSLKITLNQNLIKNDYFVKLLFLSKLLGGFENFVNISAQPALSLGGLNNLSLPCPPIKEQLEIISYIEQHTDKIDKAIFQKQEEIEKLKEYKSTLIDSAVTGKICLVN